MWNDFWTTVPNIIKEASNSEMTLLSMIMIFVFIIIILLTPKDSNSRRFVSFVMALFLVFAGSVLFYKIFFFGKSDVAGSSSNTIGSTNVSGNNNSIGNINVSGSDNVIGRTNVGDSNNLIGSANANVSGSNNAIGNTNVGGSNNTLGNNVVINNYHDGKNTPVVNSLVPYMGIKVFSGKDVLSGVEIKLIRTNESCNLDAEHISFKGQQPFFEGGEYSFKDIQGTSGERVKVVATKIGYTAAPRCVRLGDHVEIEMKRNLR